jgi:hypothetical protein
MSYLWNKNARVLLRIVMSGGFIDIDGSGIMRRFG